jgi:hypothetical protein
MCWWTTPRRGRARFELLARFVGANVQAGAARPCSPLALPPCVMGASPPHGPVPSHAFKIADIPPSPDLQTVLRLYYKLPANGQSDSALCRSLP